MEFLPHRYETMYITMQKYNIPEKVFQLLYPLPPIGVTFSLRFVNVIQADLPPSFLDIVTKYSGFFF